MVRIGKGHGNGKQRQVHSSAEVYGRTQKMNVSDRGSKHICPKCEAKYYDLKKPNFVCPSCGAKPAAARFSKATSRSGK